MKKRFRLKFFSYMLVFLQFINFFPTIVVAEEINTSSKTNINIKASGSDGTVKYNESTKNLEVYIEGMIPSVANVNYEYEIEGYVVRLHKEDGSRFLIQIGADNSDQSYGFQRTNYQKWESGGYWYEKQTNVLSLYNLQKFFEADHPNYDFSDITSPSANTTFYFDAIYSTKVPGETSYRGGVNSKRQCYGEYYMTLRGSHAYNPNDYIKSNNYTPISYYDKLKGGVIGFRSYESGGTPWFPQAIVDIENNYNKFLYIKGSSKPNVNRTVVTKYLDVDTGKAIETQKTNTYSVDATGVNHTSNAPTISGYTYLNYKTKIGSTTSSAKTGTSATIKVSSDNTVHEIIFYYDKKESKNVTVKYYDLTSKTYFFNDVVAKYSVDKTGITHTEKAPSLNAYSYQYSRTDLGSGLGTNNTSSSVSINVNKNQSKHEIVFYYKQKELSNPTPKGTIVFNPNTTNWKNQNISVKLTVNGDTEISKTGLTNRTYTYTNGLGQSKTATALAMYTQVWQISNINVSVKSALDINNASKTVSLSQTSNVLNLSA